LGNWGNEPAAIRRFRATTVKISIRGKRQQ
jgi:hypothetical protein